jgi:hypothetical protein
VDRFADNVYRMLNDRMVVVTTAFEPARFEEAVDRLSTHMVNPELSDQLAGTPRLPKETIGAPVLDLLNAAWAGMIEKPANADLIHNNVSLIWQGRSMAVDTTGLGDPMNPISPAWLGGHHVRP